VTIIAHTNTSLDDVLDALNTATKEINRGVVQRNEFAKSMLVVDPEMAKAELDKSAKLIAASKLLLRFGLDLMEERYDND
jgi:predicted metalloprotease with PDZ domain